MRSCTARAMDTHKSQVWIRYAQISSPAPDAVVTHAWELTQSLQGTSPTMKAVVNACYQCLRDSTHQDGTLTTAVSAALSVAVSAFDQIFALLKAVWQVYCRDVQRVDTLSQLTLSLTQALGVAPPGLKDIAPTIANIIANYLPLKYHAPATAAYLHASDRFYGQSVWPLAAHACAYAATAYVRRLSGMASRCPRPCS